MVDVREDLLQEGIFASYFVDDIVDDFIDDYTVPLLIIFGYFDVSIVCFLKLEDPPLPKK